MSAYISGKRLLHTQPAHLLLSCTDGAPLVKYTVRVRTYECTGGGFVCILWTHLVTGLLPICYSALILFTVYQYRLQASITHDSMSSTYTSLLLYAPNTTALWWSIIVKVWSDIGGGFSPLVGWADHIPANTINELHVAICNGYLRVNLLILRHLTINLGPRTFLMVTWPL